MVRNVVLGILALCVLSTWPQSLFAGIDSYPTAEETNGASDFPLEDPVETNPTAERQCWTLEVEDGYRIEIEIRGEVTEDDHGVQVVLYEFASDDNGGYTYNVVAIGAVYPGHGESSLEYWATAQVQLLLTAQLVDSDCVPVEGDSEVELSLLIEEGAPTPIAPTPTFEDYTNADQLEAENPVEVGIENGPVYVKFIAAPDVFSRVVVLKPESDYDWVMCAAYLVDTEQETVTLDRVGLYGLGELPTTETSQQADVELFLFPRSEYVYLIAIWSPCHINASFDVTVEATSEGGTLEDAMEEWVYKKNVPAGTPVGLLPVIGQGGPEQPSVPTPTKWEDPTDPPPENPVSQCKWKIQMIRNYPDLYPRAKLPQIDHHIEIVQTGPGQWSTETTLTQSKDNGYAYGEGYAGMAYADASFGYRRTDLGKDYYPDVDFTGEWQGRMELTATAVGGCIHKAKAHGFSCLHASVNYSIMSGDPLNPLAALADCEGSAVAGAYRYLNASPLFNTPISHSIVAGKGRKQKFKWNPSVSIPAGGGVAPEIEVESSSLEAAPAPEHDERISAVETVDEVVVLCNANAHLNLSGKVGKLFYSSPAAAQSGHDQQMRFEPKAAADLAFCFLSLICQPQGTCTTRTVIKFEWRVGWDDSKKDLVERISTDGAISNPAVTHSGSEQPGEGMKGNTMTESFDLAGN